MEIAVIGVSHKEAPVPVRGQVAFTTSMKVKATEVLKDQGLKEFMIISTCNRSEIYIASSDINKDIETVKSYYEGMAGEKILPFIFVKKYEVALQHIYQVAAGLNSLIIGEDEILGQMKRALEFAIEQKSSKKYLSKVVREAVTFSKKIRHDYKLSENQLSVAAIGIRYMKDYFGDLSGKKVLLIGTGVMGQLILKYLENEGMDITLTNRTYCKEKHEIYLSKAIELVEYVDRYDHMSDMDVVISATASPHVVIKGHKLPSFHKEVVFLDMAVPRDIDPKVDTMDKARVVTLDDFNAISEKHMNVRHETANLINRLILEEVKAMELWILRSKVDGVIKAFHKKQKRIVANNVKVLKAMDLPENQEIQVKEMLESSTWAMIREPVEQMKSLHDQEDIDHYKMIIEKLFEFDRGEV